MIIKYAIFDSYSDNDGIFNFLIVGIKKPNYIVHMEPFSIIWNKSFATQGTKFKKHIVTIRRMPVSLILVIEIRVQIAVVDYTVDMIAITHNFAISSSTFFNSRLAMEMIDGNHIVGIVRLVVPNLFFSTRDCIVRMVLFNSSLRA